MPYKNYKKLSQLTEKLGVRHQIKPFVPLLALGEVSSRLLADLEDAILIPLTTEKAKSEHIVVPVLKELLRKNIDKISYFSGFQFDVDTQRDLSGYCDFILSAQPRQMEVAAPIFCLVEAKNAEIERGLAQCGAEMYAAHLWNSQKGTPHEIIYGCVTNGFSWCFLKLENNILWIDSNYIPLTFSEPHRVVAAMEWILKEVE